MSDAREVKKDQLAINDEKTLDELMNDDETQVD